ncbi:PREDICTED: putative F-box protein At5g41500 [Camelina sativa]|uniref:F-box protein At5g41500 n=1 Tax=Camelina sativa TaxID=90675 RepID=A0ABM0SLD9_CAMSA|nr:PREDICTED: putative F-box protein At5g41500 [Camelina sativa]
MISDLPRDLIEDIINRLPMKSLKAVRLTCKSWNSLSQSESFKKMHIGKSTRKRESMMIVVQHHSIYLMSSVVDVDPCIELKGKLSFLNNQVSISRIRHYEGLVLCFLKDVTRIVVWNPYWGQTRWIKLRYTHLPQGYFNYTLGYEDKESCRSLKLLRFVDYFHREPEEQFFWYEMYDFDSGLWTTLDVAPHWGIYCSSSSVSLKGNSYWCAKERSSEGCKDRIICFDFTKERFGPLLPLPSCVKDLKYAYVHLSCVKEEKIAALFHHHYDYEFEIWITTNIEAEMVSWSKFLRIDSELKINFPDCFFIDEEKKVFMCVGRDYGYDSYSDECPKPFIKIIGEAGYSKDLDLGVPAYKNRWLISVCSYVPSLVQIKKLARGKRIEHSSLEKRQFDQNMLRLAEIEKLMKKPYRHGCR